MKLTGTDIELNTLYNDDCLNFMRGMPDKSVNLILTDPPYGVNLKYDVYKDTEANWYSLMEKFIPEAIRVSKMVICPCCQINKLPWIYKNYPPDWLICWYKGSTGCASFIGFNDWEPLLVYGKNKRIYMHDYIAIANNEKMGNYGHPCPKPLRWAKWLIHRATKEDMIVFDPFIGSGTVAVACEQLGRNWIGCEISEGYYNIANTRIEVEQNRGKFDL